MAWSVEFTGRTQCARESKADWTAADDDDVALEDVGRNVGETAS